MKWEVHVCADSLPYDGCLCHSTTVYTSTCVGAAALRGDVGRGFLGTVLDAHCDFLTGNVLSALEKYWGQLKQLHTRMGNGPAFFRCLDVITLVQLLSELFRLLGSYEVALKARLWASERMVEVFGREDKETLACHLSLCYLLLEGAHYIHATRLLDMCVSRMKFVIHPLTHKARGLLFSLELLNQVDSSWVQDSACSFSHFPNIISFDQ